jgi:hypothetical protein
MDQTEADVDESRVEEEPLMNPMPHSSPKSAYILFVLLLLFSFGLGIYILATPSDQNVFTPYFKKTFPQNQIQPLASESAQLTQTPAPTPIIDMTGWNTYINKQYKYSVKYPQDWTVANLGELEPKIPNYVSFNPPEATSSAKEVLIEYSTRSYQEVLALSPATTRATLVASISAAVREEEDSNHIISVFVIMPIEQHTIIFRGHKQFEAIFNKMLETFTLL